MCYLIESQDDFEAATRRCLFEGAELGQKLFRFAPASAIGHERSPAVPERVIRLDPHSDFLGGGALNPHSMFSRFAEQAAVAQHEGFSGIRVVADMDWLLAHPPSPSELADFELVLDKVVTDLGATVVCAYRPGSFGSATSQALAVHPLYAGTSAQPAFRIWYGGDGGWHLSGVVDMTTEAAFARALHVAGTTAAVRWIGCTNLTFISAEGIALLSRATAGHDRIRIVDAPAVLRRCWQALGLDELQPHVTFADSAGTGVHAGRIPVAHTGGVGR